MNKDVFTAILALDSYNRGNGATIANMGGPGTYLGKARLLNADLPAGSEAVGFYASAYDTSRIVGYDASKVISYRGTDFDFTGGISSPAFVDIMTGWSMFTGMGVNAQAAFAQQFYTAVTGVGFPVGQGSGPGNVILTGHSLGGALASYVGTQGLVETVAFDPIPYAQATISNVIYRALLATIAELDLTLSTVAEALLDEFFPTTYFVNSDVSVQEFAEVFAAQLHAMEPDWAAVSGFRIDGEVAGPAPTYQTVGGAIAALAGGSFGNVAISLLGLSQIGNGILNQSVDQSSRIDTRPNYEAYSGGLFDFTSANALHSQALLTTVLYAEKQLPDEAGGEGWKNSFKYIGSQLSNEIIAGRLGITGDEIGGQLAAKIAYSAIDEGERPFGDTGIRALFDDANDFGDALTSAGAGMPLALQGDAAKLAVGRVITEFSGLAAQKKAHKDQSPRIIDGVLELVDGTALTIDLTQATWSLHGLLAQPHDIQSDDQLKEELISALLSPYDTEIVDQIEDWLAYVGGVAERSISDVVDGIGIFFGGGQAEVPGRNGSYRLIFGSEFSTYLPVDFGPSIVVGGSNSDTIVGSSGNDALYGGGGTDTLIGGAGNDWFNGGTGNAVVWGDAEGGGGDGHDRVSYSIALGTYRVSYQGLEENPFLQVVHDSGSDQLHDVEEVYLGTGQVVLSVDGGIKKGENITIYAGSGGVQTIVPRNFGNGITLINGDVPGQSYIRDRVTEGEIRLVGFNTEVIGTDFDDELYDYSDEEKTVIGGGGNDVIEVGSGDAIIFGGEGYDQIKGGDGDDIIIDVNSERAFGYGSWGTDQGVINSGAGDDTILISLPKDLINNNIINPTPSDYPLVYSIDSGEGNDHIELDFYHGDVNFEYARGDGHDVITQLSQAEYVYHSTLNFDGLYIYQPTISINFSGYDDSEISVTWSQDEVFLISEDIPNRDGGNYWLQRGTVIIAFSDGGSITINDVYGVIHSDAATYDELPLGQGHGEPYIEFNGSNGNIPITIGPGVASFAVYGAGHQSPPLMQSSGTGDQDIRIDRGEHQYLGGEGSDRLTIAWDPNSILATLSGTTLTVSDRWGVIGTTSVTDFDEVYVVAQDRVYSPQEFFDAFSSPDGPFTPGSEGNDVLTGGAGADRLIGNGGDDILTGLGGHDILDGGIGADEMAGGAGDDIYYVDNIGDVVSESVDGGIDRVHSSIDFELPENVENLHLTGSAEIGVGNSGDNHIIGNDLANSLSGGQGYDRLEGGGGDDFLTGGAGNDLLIGGDGSDELIGGEGNDTLRGGAGDDTMIGGVGDDVYYVDNAADLAIEASGEGTDVVYSSVDFAMSDDIEILHLQKSGDPFQVELLGWTGALGGTIYGTSDGDYLFGNDGVDMLHGNGGDDYFEGMGGNDILSGGAGSDEIYGDDGDDLILGGAGSDFIEGGSGNDLLVGSGTASLADIGKYVPKDMSGDGQEFDTAYFYGPREDYTITNMANGWFKIESIAAAGAEVDYVVNIDELVFIDLDDPEGDPASFLLAPPELDSTIPALELSEDTPFSVALSDSWFVDPNGGEIEYSLALPGGDSLPSWLTFDGISLSGVAPENFDGTFFLELTAEGDTGSASAILTLDIASVNDAPVVADPLQPVEILAGEAFELGVPFTTFDDVDGDQLSLTARLSDGSPLPSWLCFNGTSFSGTPPTGQAGFVDIEVLANDGALSVSEVFRLTISEEAATENSAPILSQSLADSFAARGNPISLVVPMGAFNDPDGDTLSYVATLSDGASLPAWLSFDGAQLFGTAPAAALGAIDIKITASDGDLETSDIFTLMVGVETGPELTPSQWELFGNGNDRIVSRGSGNVNILSGQGDDYVTADYWAVSIQAGDGNDVIELLGDDGLAEGGAGADHFIFDGFSLMRTSQQGVNWATIADFENGVDRIGIVNGTGGVNDFAGLLPYLSQSGSDVLIQFNGLPTITIEDFDLADFDASDFMFGAWLTADFGPAPAAGILPYPSPSIVTEMSNWVEYTNAGERIVGNGNGSSTILSLDGDDYLTVDGWNVSVFAGRGNDVVELFGTEGFVEGGPGYDYFVFDPAMLIYDTWETNWATIGDFHDGVDKIAFLNSSDGLDSFSDLSPFLSQVGADVHISLSGRPGIVIEDILLSDLDASDFLFVTQNPTVAAFQDDQQIRIANSIGLTSVSANGFDNVSIIGTSNDDQLDFSAVALAGIVQIDGKEGDDAIVGTSSADTLRGGDGADVLTGGQGDDVLNGGAGSDQAAFTGEATDYSLVTTGGTVSLVDDAPTVDGDDGTDTLIGVEQLLFKNDVTVNISSPIILDLDGGGVTTLSAGLSISRYDMDGDGIGDDTSWMGRGEGMLFLDRDGNGTLSDAGEFSFVGDVANAASDLVGLRAFDSNGDGRLGVGDSRFGDFRIWRDRDGNGVVGHGEILFLADAGVQSLDLTGTAVNASVALGDVVTINTGTFTRTDGTSAAFIDAALTYFSGSSEMSAVRGKPARPIFRRQLGALDRDGLRGGRHQEFHMDRRFFGNPIAYWPEPGDQWRRSGPSAVPIEPRDDVVGAQASQSAPTSNFDRQLAMMVQEMSVFGLQSGGEGLRPWQRENVRPMDFFA